MHLSYTPKFHVLFEHVPGTLRAMNGFFDMGEDAIERWHQIRTRHDARMRSLRSKERQKLNIAKHEHVTNNANVNNVMSDVNEKTEKNFKSRTTNAIKTRNSERKKSARDERRAAVKVEVENEDRAIMPTNRDRLKEECQEESHAV